MELLAIRVDLDTDLTERFKGLKNHFGINTNTDMIRFLIKEKYRAIFEKQKLTDSSKQIITINDKTILEVIAQDHWNQFESFEEEELANTIEREFKLDPSKPKDPIWLRKAIAFCCSLKRN